MSTGEGPRDPIDLEAYRQRKLREAASLGTLSESHAREIARTIVKDFSSKEALVTDFKKRDAADRENRYPMSPLSEEQIAIRVDESLESQRSTTASYSEESLVSLLATHSRTPEHFAKTYVLAIAEAYLALQEKKK